MIHILLKNKLIALDVIAPLLLHLSYTQNVRFNIVTFDEELIQTLENNIVLKDIVNSLGDITYVGRYSRDNKVFSRVVNLLWLIKISLRIILNKEILIHFGMLNQYPLKILYLINKKRTYICDKKAWLMLKNKFDITNSKISFKCGNVAAHYSINFSKNSIYLNCNALNKSNLVKNFKYYNPKQNKIWIDYIWRVSDKYFSNEIQALNIKSDRIITLIATKFGARTKNDNSGFERDLMFFETLVALSELSQQFPIAIKEHMYTDSNRMHAIIRLATIKTSGRLRYYITKLHPSVLATKSVAALCHNTSATFYDFRCFDVPTIALTEYQDDSNEGIDNQTHTTKFINANDLKHGRLGEYIEKISKLDKSISCGHEDEDGKLFDLLLMQGPSS